MTSSKCGMREARHGAAGLSAAGQVQGPGDGAHVCLGQPRVGQRAEHSMVGGGLGAGPVRSEDVVGVLAVGHGGQPVLGDDLVGDPREQLVLAVEAAVRAVGAVGGALPLVGARPRRGEPRSPRRRRGRPGARRWPGSPRRPGSPRCGPARGSARQVRAGRRSRHPRRRRRPTGAALRWRQPPAGRRGRSRHPRGGTTPVGRGSGRGERLAPPGCPGNCSSRRRLLGWLHRLGLLPRRSGPHPAPAPSPVPTGCPATAGLCVEHRVSHRS